MNGVVSDGDEFYRLVYFGGCEHDIRKEAWPFLLGHYAFGSTPEERNELDETSRHYYETTMSEWLAVEAIVRQRDKEKTAIAVAKLSSESGKDEPRASASGGEADDMDNDVFEENGYSDLSEPEYENEQSVERAENERKSAQIVGGEGPSRTNKNSTDSGNVADSNDIDIEVIDCREIAESESMEKDANPAVEAIDSPKDADEYKMAVEEMCSRKSTPSSSSYETVANEFVDLAAQLDDIDKMHMPATILKQPHAVIVTDASIDIVATHKSGDDDDDNDASTLSPLQEEATGQTSLDALQEPKSACVSPASSNGGVYSVRESSFSIDS